MAPRAAWNILPQAGEGTLIEGVVGLPFMIGGVVWLGALAFALVLSTVAGRADDLDEFGSFTPVSESPTSERTRPVRASSTRERRTGLAVQARGGAAGGRPGLHRQHDPQRVEVRGPNVTC